MRLLKAIGKMLACMVAGCAVFAVVFEWTKFCFDHLNDVRGLVVVEAPFVASLMVALTRKFYKGQP